MCSLRFRLAVSKGDPQLVCPANAKNLASLHRQYDDLAGPIVEAGRVGQLSASVYFGVRSDDSVVPL